MDTNLIPVLLEMLHKNPSGSSDTYLIIIVIINAIATIGSALITHLARVDVSIVKDTATKTADAVQKIEVHTNSERTATLKLVEDQRAALLALAKEISTLKERERALAITPR